MAVSNQTDIRVAVISKIWAYATASIALSVLFAVPGRSWKVVLLPSTIALGATISTIVIWGKSNYRKEGRNVYYSLADSQAIEIGLHWRLTTWAE